MALLAWILFPPQREAQSTDVVMVLAGANDGRHKYGAELVNQGLAPNFVVSNPSGTRDIVGTSYCQGANQPESAEQTWCLKPNPISTTGEAQTLEVLAQEQNWETATIVTNRTHARRVQQNFNHCTDLDATVVWVDVVNEDIIEYVLAHEAGGLMQLWFTDHC
ncbi:YdcF family protein [Corynebacterium sp. S7]